jgi:hypothetical protein
MTGAPACPMSDHQKGAVAAFLALHDRLQASFAAATFDSLGFDALTSMRLATAPEMGILPAKYRSPGMRSKRWEEASCNTEVRSQRLR